MHSGGMYGIPLMDRYGVALPMGHASMVCNLVRLFLVIEIMLPFFRKLCFNCF